MDRLLPTKLAIPHPSREPISRRRLLRLLSGALQARLTLLSAPPGFGKSTALIEWLAASGVKNSWISLDEADNDPARFLRYLWAGVSKLTADDGTAATDRAPQADSLEVATELAALLAERPEPSVLVLDDYHVITAPAVRRTVGLLLERLPGQSHLVIASRVDPALPLARLRAQGELLEIRADALRFTSDEARAFLADRMGVALTDADLDTLMVRTEGWPAVLQLAGLSLAGRPDVSRRVREFAASNRFVLDYITDEVLARLEPEEREFLLRTSVPDRLTGPLCDALLGSSGGQEMLEHLERVNVLLVPLDDERRWYRYHHLFAQLLRARLAAADPELPRALELRASQWYAEHGFAAEAIEHGLRSGDVDRAVGVIAACGGVLIHAGELVTLLGMMNRLPEGAVRSHFRLSTFYALSLALSGQTEGVESHLADAEAALPAAVAAGLPGAPVQASYHALVRSIAARIRRDGPAAVLHAEQALALAPPGAAPLLADIRGTLGLALLDVGEVDRAIDELRGARPALRSAGNWIALADSTRDLARAEARRGRFRAALEACDEVLRDFVDLDGNEMPAAARIQLARAQILELTGSPEAVQAAEHAAALARRGGDATTLRDARELVAKIAASVGKRKSTSLVEPLTDREREVLRFVALGRSNRQIAAELFVAVGTVKSHVNSIMGKLGAANRVEAIARARELGLLP